ncbi:MAG: tetratricopeptide repeat protein [Pseudomonadota bacterium]|nr:tetratricopeptide repeat protein [Pseudomonadota bacterium]
MKNAMVALTVALYFAALPARADFAAGAKAYDGGDYKTAFAEWSVLAESGDSDAQVALAGLYRHGLGRDYDMVQAAIWYRRAAEQGDVIGQLNLGEFHLTGARVKRNPVEAYMWLSLSAARGNDWAVAKRNELSVHLTRDQLSRAMPRINAWRPRPPANAGH